MAAELARRQKNSRTVWGRMPRVPPAATASRKTANDRRSPARANRRPVATASPAVLPATRNKSPTKPRLGRRACGGGPRRRSARSRVGQKGGRVDAFARSQSASAERLAQLPEQVREEELVNARAVAGDGPNGWKRRRSGWGRSLRAIVAPRVDELAKLEEQLAALDERLDKLDSDPKGRAVGTSTPTNSSRARRVENRKELRQEFVDEMRQAGWTPEAQRRAWIGPDRRRLIIRRLRL